MLKLALMKKASHHAMINMEQWEALVSLGSESTILWYIHGAFYLVCYRWTNPP
ncbi:hypothetical protein VAEU17_4290390 [Vibrio aestuarianus]|nr:hypothetical protein VAEU17_4290390 [Vibrio aestuarianus]